MHLRELAKRFLEHIYFSSNSKVVPSNDCSKSSNHLSIHSGSRGGHGRVIPARAPLSLSGPEATTSTHTVTLHMLRHASGTSPESNANANKRLAFLGVDAVAIHFDE